MTMVEKRNKLENVLNKVVSETPSYNYKKVGCNTYYLFKDISYLGKGYPSVKTVGLYRVKKTNTGIWYQRKINNKWFVVDIYSI